MTWRLKLAFSVFVVVLGSTDVKLVLQNHEIFVTGSSTSTGAVVFGCVCGNGACVDFLSFFAANIALAAVVATINAFCVAIAFVAAFSGDFEILGHHHSASIGCTDTNSYVHQCSLHQCAG